MNTLSTTYASDNNKLIIDWIRFFGFDKNKKILNKWVRIQQKFLSNTCTKHSIPSNLLLLKPSQ